MKILVPIKRVLDPYMKVKVKSDGSGVDLNGAKMTINPFCEIALEEAIRLKDKGIANEVMVVTVGEQKAKEQLRAALAMGADQAIQVQVEDTLEPLIVAKILVEVVKQQSPHVLIFGKQSIDGGYNQTGQMVATLLGWPQATFISEITHNGDALTSKREVDEGIETLHVKIPAVLTCDLRLNEPRITGLPQIMQAKSKPLEVLDIADLGVDLTPRTERLEVMEPAVRQAGVIVDSVQVLVEKLRHEAKVI